MLLIDTHCHIHDSEFFPDNREEVYRQSREAGVVMLCVGTDERSSREAVEFARTHEGCHAIVGIHPHEAKTADVSVIDELLAGYGETIVGVGEIGLDYYYDHSSRDVQKKVLRQQLALAKKYGKPVSFHVRDAYDDFWPIFDEMPVSGVMHSFTDKQANVDKSVQRGLHVGVNGISTFTKDADQIELFKALPLESIVLETDAPFLTPRPFRGKMNLPAYVGLVAEHLAALKEVRLSDVERITTANAKKVFGSNL